MPSSPIQSVTRFSGMLDEVLTMTPQEILDAFSRAELIHVARSLCWHGVENGKPTLDLVFYILSALERGLLPDLTIFKHRVDRKLGKHIGHAIGHVKKALALETDPDKWLALWERLQTLERIRVEKTTTERLIKTCAAMLEFERQPHIENERSRLLLEKQYENLH